ncbi:MAG: hypothetical protein RIC29_17745 [Rhodospirillaceae bacterium]
MTNKSSSRPEPKSAAADPAATCEQTMMNHIQAQIIDTVAASAPTLDTSAPSDPDQQTTDKVQSAITAWVGMTKEGDAVEAMIAAQLVASQNLTMATIKRAMKRTTGSSHYGTCIIDACRISTLTLRQIETLARYRTWKRQS